MDGIEIARRLIAEELQKLTGFLDLENLGLDTVPREVFTLKHLRRLNLGVGFPDENRDYREASNSAGENHIQELPPALAGLTRLTHQPLRNFSARCDYRGGPDVVAAARLFGDASQQPESAGKPPRVAVARLWGIISNDQAVPTPYFRLSPIAAVRRASSSRCRSGAAHFAGRPMANTGFQIPPALTWLCTRTNSTFFSPLFISAAGTSTMNGSS